VLYPAPRVRAVDAGAVAPLVAALQSAVPDVPRLAVPALAGIAEAAPEAVGAALRARSGAGAAAVRGFAARDAGDDASPQAVRLQAKGAEGGPHCAAVCAVSRISLRLGQNRCVLV
jgi:hypothetical protein